jgi:hypothetical protein
VIAGWVTPLARGQLGDPAGTLGQGASTPASVSVMPARVRLRKSRESAARERLGEVVELPAAACGGLADFHDARI